MVGIIESADYYYHSTISSIEATVEAWTNGLFAMPLKVDGLTKLAKLISVCSRVIFTQFTAIPFIGAAAKASKDLSETLSKQDLFKRLSQLREIANANWAGQIGLIGIVAVRALEWVHFLEKLGLYSLAPVLNVLGQYRIWNLLVTNSQINLLQLTALSFDTISNVLQVYREIPRKEDQQKVEACVRIQRLWQAHHDLILKQKAGLTLEVSSKEYEAKYQDDINFFEQKVHKDLIAKDILGKIDHLDNEFAMVTKAFTHRAALIDPNPKKINIMQIEIEGRIKFWEGRKLAYGKELNKAKATIIANIAKLVGMVMVSWILPWAFASVGLTAISLMFKNKDSIVRLASDGFITITDCYKTLVGDIQVSQAKHRDTTMPTLVQLTIPPAPQ